MPVDIDLNLPTTSRFGWVVEGADHGPDPVFDRVLWRSRSFVVVPTKGSLVPGWCLIVPRRPMLSLVALTTEERAEIAEVRAKLAGRLRGASTEVFEFEHGANHAGSPTGCGVDQAHMHVVPLGFDLCIAIQAVERLHTISEDPIDLWGNVGTREYVLVRRDRDMMTRGFFPRSPTSQFVRKVIASQLGQDARWDYRVHTGRESALRTIELLRA